MILKDFNNNAHKLSNWIYRVLRENRYSVKFNRNIKASQIFKSLVKLNLIIIRKKINKRRNSTIIKLLREFVNN